PAGHQPAAVRPPAPGPPRPRPRPGAGRAGQSAGGFVLHGERRVSEHLTETDLRALAAGTLAPERLLAVDDHLSQCPACRTRALSGTGPAARDLAEALQPPPGAHLSDEEVELYADGTAAPDARRRIEEHTASCPTCAEQVADLRDFIRGRRRGLPRAVLFAAAAVLVAALVPVAWWSRDRPREQPGFAELTPEQQAHVRAALAAGAAGPPRVR